MEILLLMFMTAIFLFATFKLKFHRYDSIAIEPSLSKDELSDKLLSQEPLFTGIEEVEIRDSFWGSFTMDVFIIEQPNGENLCVIAKYDEVFSNIEDAIQRNHVEFVLPKTLFLESGYSGCRCGCWKYQITYTCATGKGPEKGIICHPSHGGGNPTFTPLMDVAKKNRVSGLTITW